MCLLGSSQWWPKYLGSCHPYGILRLGSWLLASVWSTLSRCRTNQVSLYPSVWFFVFLPLWLWRMEPLHLPCAQGLPRTWFSFLVLLQLSASWLLVLLSNASVCQDSVPGLILSSRCTQPLDLTSICRTSISLHKSLILNGNLPPGCLLSLKPIMKACS